MGQELEVYRIIATISVALASVTITTYAIATSILGSERLRWQAEIEDIKRKTDERFHRGEIKDSEAAEKEIDRLKAERRKIISRVSRLSLTNVVLFPSLFFALSASFAVAGMLAYPQVELGPQPPQNSTQAPTYVQVSALGLFAGIVALINALFAIEKAAGQPRPTQAFVGPPAESGIVAYYFVDYPGTKILVDWSTKIAYWFDNRLDEAAVEGKFRLVAVPGKTQDAFIKEKGLKAIQRGPTRDELPL